VQARLIHIVEDESLVRRSTAFLLRTRGYCVKEWLSGAEFIAALADIKPGAILLDMRMPGMGGLDVQKELAQRGCALPVVVVTGHGDIALAVHAMRAGAVDFLEKPLEQEQLMEALHLAFQKLDSTATAASRAERAQWLIAKLSPREKEVLDCLARGLPNKTIAGLLGITTRTAEVHRAHVMTKLNARSLSDALRVAFAAGLG
jgi:two-component system, LuxR family, response regulator FixJ